MCEMNFKILSATGEIRTVSVTETPHPVAQTPWYSAVIDGYYGDASEPRIAVVRACAKGGFPLVELRELGEPFMSERVDALMGVVEQMTRILNRMADRFGPQR